MTHAKIEITRFVDDAQPGWVEAVMVDAWKQKWTFVQKIHSFTDDDLDSESDYPIQGYLECAIVGSYLDRDERLVAVIRAADERRNWTDKLSRRPLRCGSFLHFGPFAKLAYAPPTSSKQKR